MPKPAKEIWGCHCITRSTKPPKEQKAPLLCAVWPQRRREYGTNDQVPASTPGGGVQIHALSNNIRKTLPSDKPNYNMFVTSNEAENTFKRPISACRTTLILGVGLSWYKLGMVPGRSSKMSKSVLFVVSLMSTFGCPFNVNIWLSV